MYTVELVWNREFHWVSYAVKSDLKEAITYAKSLENMGDGACVKKTRITLDGEVVWQYGRMVKNLSA